MTMRRLCLALDLKDDPDLIAQYRAWHRPGGPPAAVNKSIRSSGVETMEIYLCGNRLFMVMDVNEDFSVAKKAATDKSDPDVKAWETQMDVFQQALPWAKAGEKWLFAQRIYALSEQP